MFTEMNSAGLSSICQGTNGLNGSAFRAIRSTFEAALAPGVCDPVPVPVGVQAARSSAPITAAMTGHPVFRVSMNLSLQRKKLTIETSRVVAPRREHSEFARPPLRACHTMRAPGSHYPSGRPYDREPRAPVARSAYLRPAVRR